MALTTFLLFLYFMPRAIAYSAPWAGFCLTFILLPYLVFKTLETFNINPNLPVVLAFASVLIVGPTMGLFHQYREKRELQKDGIWTKAVVIDEKKSTTKGYKGWLIQLAFNAKDGRHETYYESDEQNRYSIGDTIDILYLPEFPEIYSLGYQWPEE